MNDSTYLIFHKDHLMDPSGVNSGAEMATLFLARYLARTGRRVVVCAQLKNGSQVLDKVEFRDLGASFDVGAALEKARSLGSYHLISAGRALPVMQSLGEKICRSRSIITHDRSGNDTGISPKVLSAVADNIFCVSEAQRQVFTEAGADHAKTIVIHNGVDHEIFTPGDPAKRDFNRIVFAGALVQDKGIHLLVNSFIRLKSAYPDLELDVYGSSSLWGRDRLFDEKEIERQVKGIHFHGNVKQEVLAEAFRRAGLCVVPSIWFDPFPLVSIDAQACGCPVAAFDAGGLKEGIIDGKTGVVIGEISEQALTRTLGDLLSDKRRLQEMSENALRLSRPRFTWEKLVEQVTSACEKRAAGTARSDSSEVSGGVVGFLTTWNQECGLATYARYLVSEFEEGTYKILAEDTEEKRTGTDEEYVVRCWKKDSPDLSGLERAVADHGISLLYLNCHYRFFARPAMGRFLAGLRQKGIKVVVHLHNTFTYDPKFAELVTNADKVIVHSAENGLEAVANGADPDSVEILPHGVCQNGTTPENRSAIREKLGMQEGEKSLVCFGFVQAHKGMEGMIEAVHHLTRNGIPARGYVAGYVAPGDPSSADYLAKLKAFAAELKISDRIYFADRFLSDAEVADYLAAADVVLMNYRSQHYEASGACSLALGAGAVVAASTAPLFNAFSDAVWHINAGYPVSLSVELLLSSERLRETVRRNALAYAERNSWPNIHAKVLDIFSKMNFKPLKPAGEIKVIAKERGENTSKQFARNLNILIQNRINAYAQRGGDTVLMQKTIDGLVKRGVKVTVDLEGKEDPANYDLLHLFNFALPDLVKALGERAQKAGTPFVVTTLYEDIPRFHNQSVTLAALLKEYVARGQDRAWFEAGRGQIRQAPPCGNFNNDWAARNAAALFANGENEARTLRADYRGINNVQIVPVGYDIGRDADPGLFYKEYGVKDFILCVGRLESRKNQLMLLKALEDSEIPVVLAAGGFSYQPEYEEAVRRFKRKGKTLVLGRLSDEMLASAYAAARVHALPSWYELPGLVSLEAAFYGCNVVVTELGTARDYFGDKAFYCDPADERSIFEAAQAAYYSPLKEGLKEVAMKNTWDDVAEKTLEAYQKVIPAEVSQPQNRQETVLTYDLDSGVTDFQDILERGEMAAKAHDYENAHNHLANAERLNPQSVRALRARGAVYLAQGNITAARDYFKRALTLDGDNAKLYSGLGMCEMQEKSPRTAYQYFLTALDLAPTELVAILQLIECSYVLGKYHDLERVLRRYLEEIPGDPEMEYCLAGCLYKQERYGESEAIIDQILKANPSHLGSKQLKSVIEEARKAGASGNNEAASAETAAVPAQAIQFDATDVRIVETEELKRKRSYDEAKAECDGILADGSIRPDQREKVTLIRAEIHVLENEIPVAEGMYDAVLASNPGSARALCGKGAITANRGDWQTAKDYFTKANEIDPNYDVAWAGLGLYRYWAGDFDSAWQHFVRATDLNPENVRAILGIIELGYPLNKLAEVERIIKVYLDMHPVDLGFMYSLAGCYFAQNKLEEARSEIDKITLFDPQNDKALELKGLIEQKLTGEVTVNF